MFAKLNSGIRVGTGSKPKYKTRSESAKDGWDTRTKHEGITQIASGIADLSNPVVSTVKSAKDIFSGTTKVVSPRKTRLNISKNKILKTVDDCQGKRCAGSVVR